MTDPGRGVVDSGRVDPATPRIVVVGSANFDQIVVVTRLPDAGETLLGEQYHEGFGGKGANQAVAAARFGPAVSIVTAVGDDARGRATIDNFLTAGVGADDVAITGPTTGVASIWVDGAGMNRIVVIPGANELVDPAAASEAVRRLKPAVVVGQFEIPKPATTAAFLAGRTTGAVTILNPAPGAAIDPALLAATDWLVPNESEFVQIGGRPLTGDAADRVAAIEELGARVGIGLIVTLGERGVVVRPRGGAVIAIPAPAVRAIDTTGAGDAFVGALAAGFALGWPVEDAATLGCAFAADSVTRRGTQASYADRAAAAALLATIRAS